MTVIEPLSGWRFIRIAELWRHRELFYLLTWRDIKVRYKQTVLGAAWAVLQPFGTMVVFSLFLGRVMQPSVELPYPLFVFAGLLPWTFFSHAVTSASQSIVGSERLVTKVYFPRLALPASAVAAGLVDFVIAFGLLAAMTAFYGVAPGMSVLMIPVIVAVLIVTALGVGTLLAALTVAYRDFRYIVPFMIQLWMFLTPGIYMSGEVIDPRSRLALPLNPIQGLIVNFRHAITGGSIEWYSLSVSCAVSGMLLVLGWVYFCKTERTFADVL